MTVGRLLLSAALVGTFGITPAAGQSRTDVAGPVPAPGMVGIGASIGAAPPLEASFTNGLNLTGNIEGYLTRRVSLRAQVSGAFWDITGRGFTGTVRPIAVDGNVVYNFEGGKIHPFLTGGVGLYHYRFAEQPTTGSADKFGVNMGGGLEYFFHRHATATAEVLFHDITSSSLTSPVTIYSDPNYWTFTAGLKKYF